MEGISDVVAARVPSTDCPRKVYMITKNTTYRDFFAATYVLSQIIQLLCYLERE